jgi:hypothetical protein
MNTLFRKSRLKASVAGVSIVTLVMATFALSSFAIAEDQYATAAELKLMQGFPPPPDKQITKATALQTPSFNRWSYRVNNQSFQQALYDKIWSKIGTDGETYVLLDNNATLVAGGSLNTTPYNLARFAMMMIHDGKFNI